MHRKDLTFKICLSGIFLAIALVLPFITGQIPELGKMLCPMHIPVLLCGFLCGWKYGALVGFICPLLRFAMFGMPSIYPDAIAMAFELATYGFVSGFIYNYLEKKDSKHLNVFLALISALILGRISWGAIRYLLALIDGSLLFNINIFLAGAFVNAWPGIIIQIILVPSIVIALNNNIKNKNL